MMIAKHNKIKPDSSWEAKILILGGFVFLVLSKMIYWVPRDIFLEGIPEWVYTDWLIDYSSGFVRRGLSGELIRYLASYVQPKAAIGGLTWLIFGVVFVAFIRLVIKSLNKLPPQTLVGLLFLPSLLPFYLYDHGAFGRKETLGLLILLWHLYILEKSSKHGTKQYLKRLLPISMIALPAHVLIHESSFLLFIPVHLFISYSILRRDQGLKNKKRLLYLSLIYLPVFVSLAVIVFWGRPSFRAAVEICSHWESLGALAPGSCVVSGESQTWALPASISTLPWSISQAASLLQYYSMASLATWIAVFSVLGYWTVKLGRTVTRALLPKITGPNESKLDLHEYSKSLSRWLAIKYYLIPLVLSSPLYVIGRDIGRWFAVTCINYLIIMLSREVLVDEVENSNFSYGSDVEPGAASRIQKASSFIFSSFVLGAIIVYVRLPHCCIGANVFADPIRDILEEVAHFFP